ncbi:MAG: GNAT family N-acetyltransferase [Bacilli bacterium]|nr:GNAT family N-acetyltransferase [Bacilli bacterium]
MAKNIIHLEKINWDNYGKVLKLRVTKEQEDYVASNKASLIHAFIALSNGDPVHAFAIYKDKTVIGFIQLYYDNDWTGEEYEEWLKSDEYKFYEGKYYYCIWRFMIDKKYQKQGFGREAFKQALDYIKTFPDGKAEYVVLSYEPSNVIGKKLYASFGFTEHFNEYVKEDDEITALLKL